MLSVIDQGCMAASPCAAISEPSRSRARGGLVTLRSGCYKATPFFLRLSCHLFPSMPASYSTTSLSTTHSGCITETSDSTEYTSDDQRDSPRSVKGSSCRAGGQGKRKDAEGQEDEMEEFLLGPGWVRTSPLCDRRNQAPTCMNSAITGFHLPNASNISTVCWKNITISLAEITMVKVPFTSAEPPVAPGELRDWRNIPSPACAILRPSGLISTSSRIRATYHPTQ